MEKGETRNQKLETRMRKLETGREKRDFIPQNAQDGEEVSHSQADAFARANAQEKVGLLRSK